MTAHTKIRGLRKLTVASGATPAEAKSAADLADTIERKDSSRRAEAIEYLQARGWSAAAAAGIASHLDLSPDHPDELNIAGWRGRRASMLRDWASSHDRNVRYLSSQLAFLTDELRGVFGQDIGGPLLLAKTADEASKIATAYFDFTKKGN